MKTLYFATYYIRNYVRQDVIRNALKEIEGVEVIECVYNHRSIYRYIQALWKFVILPKKDIDVIIVGFRGHEILPLIRLLTRKPIIFDALISIYDTLCFDRKKYTPTSVVGRLAYWLDKYNCSIANHIILDTNEHMEYFLKTFNVSREKFSRVFVGADQNFFFPINLEASPEKLKVFYYGTGFPLQGIDTILKAAKALESRYNIQFKLVGPIQKKFKSLIDQLDLKNVEFIDWLPYKELPKEIARADICLGGHFSSIEKAGRVISGKTFQFLAMKKPVIVGRSKATKELLNDREDCLMVNMNDAQDLARAIVELQINNQLRNNIAETGYQTYKYVQKDIEISLRKLFNLKYV